MKMKRNVKNSKITWKNYMKKILWKSRFKPVKAGLNRVLAAGPAYSWKSRLFANPDNTLSALIWTDLSRANGPNSNYEIKLKTKILPEAQFFWYITVLFMF